MRRFVVLILIVSLCLQQISAAAGTFTILKIDAYNNIHVKDVNSNYYLLYPQAGNNEGNFQENKAYSGTLVSDSAIQMIDDIGNMYTFNYVIEQNDQRPDANGINWWAVLGVIAVIAIIASASQSGGGGSGPSY
jgi:hypothetical protein